MLFMLSQHLWYAAYRLHVKAHLRWSDANENKLYGGCQVQYLCVIESQLHAMHQANTIKYLRKLIDNSFLKKVLRAAELDNKTYRYTFAVD